MILLGYSQAIYNLLKMHVLIICFSISLENSTCKSHIRLALLWILSFSWKHYIGRSWNSTFSIMTYLMIWLRLQLLHRRKLEGRNYQGWGEFCLSSSMYLCFDSPNSPQEIEHFRVVSLPSITHWSKWH